MKRTIADLFCVIDNAADMGTVAEVQADEMTQQVRMGCRKISVFINKPFSEAGNQLLFVNLVQKSKASIPFVVRELLKSGER